MAAERRFEPWPIAIGVALAVGIGIALSFWAVAAAHPDPVLVPDAKPGLEAR